MPDDSKLKRPTELQSGDRFPSGITVDGDVARNDDGTVTVFVRMPSGARRELDVRDTERLWIV